MVDWDHDFEGYVAAVDFPASLFWRELGAQYPDALVLLSTRDSAEIWRQSANQTILPFAPDWKDGHHFLDQMERFIGTKDWNDPAMLMSAYEWHNAEVRATIAPDRLLEWRAADDWEPICRALRVAVSAEPFPWASRRSERA